MDSLMDQLVPGVVLAKVAQRPESVERAISLSKCSPWAIVSCANEDQDASGNQLSGVFKTRGFSLLRMSLGCSIP